MFARPAAGIGRGGEGNGVDPGGRAPSGPGGVGSGEMCCSRLDSSEEESDCVDRVGERSRLGRLDSSGILVP